jgi:polyisoprenoid-binding protein YceI
MVMTTTVMPVIAAGSYRVDPAASVIGFTTKHLFGLGTVKGTFGIRSGQVRIGADPLTSTAAVVIDVASFHTDKPKRDQDVTSKRFLDAADHPTIEVRLTEVRSGPDGWAVAGDLIVKGTSTRIVLTLEEIEPTATGLRGVATTVVDRHAAGITYGKGLAGRYLTMTVEIAAERL